MSEKKAHTVGSRELKTRLGAHLQRVREGATLIVTDRGRPVAELRPLERGDSPLEDRLRELVALGILCGDPGRARPLEPFEPIRAAGGSLSEAIVEEREDRF